MKFIQSIAWLNEQLNTKHDDQIPPTLIIFDCRYDLMDEDAGEFAYRVGHIPGAYYAHLSHDLSSAAIPTGEGGRHPLPNPELFATFLGERGVHPTSTIVAYDDQGGAMASRLRWLLQWVGHEGEVYIIEGGYKGWVDAGYEQSVTIPDLVTDNVYELKLQSHMVVDHNYVSSRLHNESTIIIDSRDRARYRGEVEPIDKKAGHIPSALHYFWIENKDANGKWKDAEALKTRFESLSNEKEIIVYCGSGVTATPNVFALKEAGFKDVKLYAGSWSEWSSYEKNPVAVGDE